MNSRIFSILLTLIIIISYSQAQWCRRPVPQMCSGIMDTGHSGHRCIPRTMWWYNPWSRQCQPMRYRGCGGNWNRFCSFSECQGRCRRFWPRQG